MPKTWTEKFHNGKEAYVGESVRKVLGFPIGSMMLIPTPEQVEKYMRSIPFGEERTSEQMNRDLAKAAGAELTCPMCCGLFIRICSEKAFEELEAGKPIEDIAPFWRMITAKSPLRKKLTFGTSLVDSMRDKESIGQASRPVNS